LTVLQGGWLSFQPGLVKQEPSTRMTKREIVCLALFGDQLELNRSGAFPFAERKFLSFYCFDELVRLFGDSWR
jgi:hypothetical protein